MRARADLDERARARILLGVSAAAFLGPFTQTVYVPSLVEIGAELHATTLMVNLTISVYSIIFAISSFVWGPLADSRGRRAVLLSGLALFVAGSLLCLLAPSYALFLVGRIVQACGISTGSVIAATVIGDVYAPAQRQHAMSANQLVVFLGPVFGPVIGGFVAGYLHWQWAFGVLIVAGMVVLLYDRAVVPETLHHGGDAGSITLERVRSVVRDRAARAILLLGFGQFYGYYVFLVFLPLLVERFGLSTAQKGLAFVPLTAGILVGIGVARRWLSHWPSERIIGIGSWAIAATVLALWLLVLTGTLTLWLLAAAMMLFGVLLGTSLPAQSTLLVSLFSANRATAMGIYNFMRFIGAASGPLLGALVADAFGDAAMLASLGSFLLLAAYVIRRSTADAGRRVSISS
ncbi:MAG: MFS transporter [Burkholderiaceae bacterium]|nr:MFS transporter [Burkholderiaceae bacterium]